MVEGAQLLEQGVDALLAADLSRLADDTLLEALDRVEVVRRQFAAIDHLLLSEAARRALAQTTGAGSLPALVTGRWQVAPGTAKARVEAATELSPRVAISGEPLAPVLPALAAAARAGAVSTEQTAVIRRVLNAIPDETPYGPVTEVTPVAEAFLVHAAGVEHPRQLERSGQSLLARLDPDGTLLTGEQIDARRDLSMRRRRDGMIEIRGLLTPEAGEATLVVIDSLSAPTSAAQRERAAHDDGEAAPDSDECLEPDIRSAGQRRHDGLHDAVNRLLASDTLPATGGVPVTVLVRIDAADLDVPGTDLSDLDTTDGVSPDVALADIPDADGPDADSPALSAQRPRTNAPRPGWSGRTGGVGVMGHGGLISARRLLALVCHGCQAEVHTVVIGPNGATLRLGRRSRLGNRAQRRALVTRDGGCTFPGCDAPAAWCEAHHVNPWICGGPTDIDNLCLLCPRHHRIFERAGWIVTMIDGLPWWTPPAWLDPAQRPRRNHAHHPTDVRAWLDNRRELGTPGAPVPADGRRASIRPDPP